MQYSFFKCKNCGRCCLVFSGSYQNSMSYGKMVDIASTAPDNIDIFDWCSALTDDLYDYWISPKTNDFVDHCPWLRHQKSKRYKLQGYVCRLQNGIKPPACSGYPYSLTNALTSGCPGYNHLLESEKLSVLRLEFITILKKWLSFNNVV